MSEKNDVYVNLANDLGVPDSERFSNILDAMFTPEEAAICHELFNPATSRELSVRLNIPEKDISAKLDNTSGMCTPGAFISVCSYL